MLLQVDCIPCILNMTIKGLRKLKIAPSTIKKIYNDISTIPALRGEDWARTSPDIIEIIMEKLYNELQDTDPFCEIKKQLNHKVAQMVPFAKNFIQASEDPVYTAAKLAILGNSIDFMMPGGTSAIEGYIKDNINIELLRQPYLQFYQQIELSKKIVYFTDNCGEIIFDKLLIETLKNKFAMEITVVTRRHPTLNDATKKEALQAGLDQVATVIDNGIDGPLPGTILKRCSQKVQSLVNQADLIISKGGGNFDSLEEQIKILKTNITFMLLSKCYPINTYFSTHLHQPVIANFYL